MVAWRKHGFEMELNSIYRFVFYHNFPLAWVQTMFYVTGVIGPFGVDEKHTNF